MGATFLNTDLRIKARFDLSPLASALTDNGLVLLGQVTVKGGVWRATFESDLVRPNPERAASSILAAVESLDARQQTSWRACLSRCLDFGYECDAETFESTFAIDHPILSRIVSAGASMAVTVYRSSGPGEESTVNQQTS